jgi:hypothetical protein
MTNTAPESLVQLFSDKRALLRQQLAEKPGIDQAAGILRNFILGLFTEYSQREKDEQRVAIIQGLAGSVAEAAQLLLGASKSTVWETPSNKLVDLLPAAPEKDHSRWVLPLIRLLVTAGLSLWLYFAFTDTLARILAIAAFGVVLALQVVEFTRALLQKRKRRNEGDLTPPMTRRIVIEVDPDTLILKLRDLLLQADRTIDQIAYAQAQANRSSGATLPDSVLDFLQELAAAHALEDKDYAALLAKKVATLLQPFGISMQVSFEGANQNMFDVEPNLEADQRRTLLSKPAFVKEGEVIRRGVVLVPRSIR